MKSCQKHSFDPHTNVDLNTLPTIFLTGPTASGKTELSLQLAQEFGGWILSADSRMVYRRLDIGTGKPTWEYRTLPESPWCRPHEEFEPIPTYTIRGIRHFGLDVARPGTVWTLADWLKIAKQTLRTISDHRSTVLVVGGTGLYHRALLQGYDLPPTEPALRRELETYSLDKLTAALAAFDPITAKREAANRRRLIRALEIVRLTGQPMSTARPRPFLERTLVVAIAPPIADLSERIARRLAIRWNHGLVEEVHDLLRDGISSEWLESLGLEYRWLTRWLTRPSSDSATDVQQAILRDSVRYAKRQLTYLRTQLRPVTVGSVHEAVKIVKHFIDL